MRLLPPGLTPEVVKVLAETFLNKRFQAGQTVGEEIGEARGEARTKAEILKLIEEHPELTLEQVKQYLHNGIDNRHNGKSD